ncbi:MAG: hypothetical protein NTW62_02130 [Candidatus Nomurabacteria bacterium]|nr:hypothetical protein [Candidatus Nomurabacteria bacterium]
MFIYPGDLEFDYEKHEIKNLNLLIENKPDFFAMNYLSGPESNCHVIKKVKEISPRTKIIFISTTIQTTSKEVLEAGADVCFDCECIPVIGGGRMTGGAAISAIAWILDNFPQEPIENTWSRKN